MVHFWRVLAAAATLMLAACQSPDMAVGALPPAIALARIAPSVAAPASLPMPVGAADQAPSGFVSFCRRQPDQCREAPDQPSRLTLDDTAWRALQAVNSAVNAAVKPMEDEIHYGRVDYWTIPADGYGDCEDYALAKRKALAEAGVSPNALRLAVAQLPDGEAHAVLTVATDRGDYVLDNQTDAVLPWRDTRLTWIARQGAGPMLWAMIEDKTHRNIAVASR